MAWFKIDDNFYAHPKVKSIPRKHRGAAIGLWTLAGSWCAQQLTDGFVPAYMLEEFGATHALAAALVDARGSGGGSGLWVVSSAYDHPEPVVRNANDGWFFHDWADHQPTRENIQAKRKQNAERLKTWRAAKTVSSNGHVTPLQTRSNSVTNAVVTPPPVTQPPTRPDPTRPDPLVVVKTSSPRGTRLADDWHPCDDLLAAGGTDFPSVDLKHETEQFRDYWLAKAGKDATKLDWNRVWRTWMRKAQKDAATRSGRNQPPRVSRTNGYLD